MAYPFAKALTFAEFKDRLAKEFGCTYIKLDVKLKDPEGKEREVYYFERTVEGQVLRVVAPDLVDGARVLYSVVRSICGKLQIDPAAFGLVLG